ncbi:MAG: phenylalanine--tRNA ligase subunit beta, partial [Bacteroidetes bacterium]|nr:phenylalanine--tRNA ligase subunit beta [Bacteroidota bacterium]
KLKEISKHPVVYRDLALILEEATTFGEIYTRCFEAEKKLLKAVNLFDVYTGKGVPESKKSYAIQLQFGDTNKTLTDKEIDKAVARIYNQLQTTLNAELRT